MAPDPFWREARAEFAGGEGIQGAEAGGKLDLGQVAPEASCSFRSSPRSRNFIRDAPAETTGTQKTQKMRACVEGWSTCGRFSPPNSPARLRPSLQGEPV